MTTFLVRRLLMGIIVILIVTVMVFLFIRLLPGDPLVMYMTGADINELSQQQMDEMKAKFGLDKPLALQYVYWVGDIFQGDLGVSIYQGVSVRYLISQRLPVTIHLGVLAFVFGNLLGVLFGVICALRRGTWIDTTVTFLANIGVTTPSFWVGIMLMYLLALKGGWLPVYGYTSPFDDFWMSARQAVMPVICLSLFTVASVCRLTRSSMLEVVAQDYIRTAWSKGLRERIIIYRHAIKNALIPVITVMGMEVGMIFGGSVLVETIFNIPGVGRLITDSVMQQDFMIVQAGTLMIAVVVVFTNLAVDIAYGWLDPRIRYD
jgi:peptide/nickel transport system permease protein